MVSSLDTDVFNKNNATGTIPPTKVSGILAATNESVTLASTSTRGGVDHVSSSVSGDPQIDFYIGLSLAISSSLFIGASFILKKKALIRLNDEGDGTSRAGLGGHGYLKDWMWWAGVLTMAFGEAFNFIAYAFAPASLVTPLGALSVLVTAVLSSRLLDEKLNLLGKIGCTICLLGSTMIVIHSPKEENVGSMEELSLKMQEPGWIVYVIFVVLSAICLIFYVGPRYGSSNIVVYIIICSLIGSLSVVGCKGIGLAITETLNGSNQASNPYTWFFLISVILCISIQLNYLNKALDLFNTSMVTPIYYVFFTSFVILASAILFKEWNSLTVLDILGNLVGFATVVIGIFQMQLFKDLNLTLSQLRHKLRKRRPIGEQFDPLLTSLDEDGDTDSMILDVGGTGGSRNGGRNHDQHQQQYNDWKDLPEGDQDRHRTYSMHSTLHSLTPHS